MEPGLAVLESRVILDIQNRTASHCSPETIILIFPTIHNHPTPSKTNFYTEKYRGPVVFAELLEYFMFSTSTKFCFSEV